MKGLLRSAKSGVTGVRKIMSEVDWEWRSNRPWVFAQKDLLGLLSSPGLSLDLYTLGNQHKCLGTSSPSTLIDVN